MTVSPGEVLEAMVLAARETHDLSRGEMYSVDVDTLADGVYTAALHMGLDVTYTQVLCTVQNS